MAQRKLEKKKTKDDGRSRSNVGFIKPLAKKLQQHMTPRLGSKGGLNGIGLVSSAEEIIFESTRG